MSSVGLAELLDTWYDLRRRSDVVKLNPSEEHQLQNVKELLETVRIDLETEAAAYAPVSVNDTLGARIEESLRAKSIAEGTDARGWRNYPRY